KQFDYAPLDARAIRAFAAPRAAQATSLSGLASAVGALKPSEVEGNLQKFLAPEFRAPSTGEVVSTAAPSSAKKRDAMPLAWACFLNAFYEKLFPTETDVSRIKGKAAGGAEGPSMLAADSESWRVVKKAAAGAEAKETFYFLVTSFLSIEKKLLELAFDSPAQASEFSSLTESFLKNYGERKSFSKLNQMLSQAAQQGVEAKITALSPRRPRLALQLFLDKVFTYSGYAPFAIPDALNAAFPELKIPKPRGRVAGSKK
ncbi:hypothetical protein H0N96_00525, partial [Candidatus Micrarchaeota archaeon]|nr:hypothetical protein [Candidatus Micrarchaeota archaeon]